MFNNFRGSGLSIALAIILVVVLIVFGPLITIWMLNTLFPALAIQYNFWTWLAAALLNVYTVRLRTSGN